MRLKISHPVWHLLSVFFLVWFIVIGGLLINGETSPVVRLAFALCGSFCLVAGSRAGWVRPRLPKPSVGWIVGFLVCGMLTAIVLPVILLARDIARKSAMHRDLRIEGQRLLKYAEDHDGVLPPKIGGRSVYKYIASAETEAKGGSYGRPFVWCADLSGLHLAEIPNRENLVVAYSTDPVGKSYGVLFLSGYSFSRTKHQLDQLLRERPALIAKAKRLKAKRATPPVRFEL
jgi:hypothetical protein